MKDTKQPLSDKEKLFVYVNLIDYDVLSPNDGSINNDIRTKLERIAKEDFDCFDFYFPKQDYDDDDLRATELEKFLDTIGVALIFFNDFYSDLCMVCYTHPVAIVDWSQPGPNEFGKKRLIKRATTISSSTFENDLRNFFTSVLREYKRPEGYIRPKLPDSSP